MRTLVVAVLCCGSLSTLGCLGDEGPPNPVPLEVTEVPPPAEPGEVRRRVELRSPVGGTPGNLLVDGDFETSIVIQGTGPQSGWLAFGAGAAYLRGATGGVCRSGLRCGFLDPGVVLFGQGASARDSGMIASVWARPPAGYGCFAVQAQVLRCNSFLTAAGMIPESETPRPDGWCFYRGRVAQQTSGVCMYLETNLTGEPALVDDARIIPDKGNVPLGSESASIPDITFEPLRGERRARVEALLKWRRDRMKLGAPLADRPDVGQR